MTGAPPTYTAAAEYAQRLDEQNTDDGDDDTQVMRDRPGQVERRVRQCQADQVDDEADDDEQQPDHGEQAGLPREGGGDAFEQAREQR